MSTRLDSHVARLKARNYAWPIAWEAVELMARREDCRLAAYQCIAGVWSIGWGETSGVTPDMVWTEDQADAHFLQQLRKYAARVEGMCTVPPSAHQLGALTSLAYNIGLAALAKSTVLRKHNAGDFDAAARAFALWNKARVAGVLQPVRGLTLRRAAEAALYLAPTDDAPGERMPQAVEAESSLAKSPIAQGGAITTAVGVVAGAKGLTDSLAGATGTLASVKAFGDQVGEFLGLPPLLLLAGVLIAAGFTVMKWRKRQREEGWT